MFCVFNSLFELVDFDFFFFFFFFFFIYLAFACTIELKQVGFRKEEKLQRCIF